MVSWIAQAILAKRALAFAIIVCGIMVIAIPVSLWESIGNDFGMYFRVANEPLDNAYLPYDDLPFPYLPTMILWIATLQYVPLWPSFYLWIAFSAAVFGIACRPYLSRSATILALASPPLIFCYLTGQVSAVLAALLLWGCGTRHRWLAGVAFGIIASIKPQLVIMVPLLLMLLKDWRAFVAAGVTFCLFVAASVWAYGLDTWFVWLGSLDEFHEMVRTEGVFSVAVTPAAMAEYWGLDPLPVLIASASFGAYLVFKCRHQPTLVLTAAVGCGSLFAAPYALIHDLAVIVPFLAWSVMQGKMIAALAIPGAMHPLPVLLTALGLVRISDQSPTDDKSTSKRETPSSD